VSTYLKSQKTELYYASAATTTSKVAAITGIQGLGGARDQIDTTTLDDTDRTFEPGFGNPGQVTVTFNLKSDSTVHSALLALKDAGTTVSWGIYSAQTTTAPTAVGSAMQTVVDRTSAIFDGYVADVNIDIAGNDIWKATMVIQRSGTVSWDFV
jgi:hypothetical protein